MSIKRSREVSRRRPSDSGSSYATKKDPERVYTWDGDVASHPAEAFVVYAPAHRYAKDALLQHAAFGKGIVTRVDGPKIEVLFQAGSKKLAHNPTGSEAPKAQPPESAGTPPTQPPPPTEPPPSA